MSKNLLIEHHFIIPESLADRRLDAALAQLLPEYSRSKLQQWIEQGDVLVDGCVARNRDKVVVGSTLDLKAELAIVEQCVPQNIQLTIVYEDDDLLVINKPVGLVVHPGAGNPAGTLVNALLNHCPSLNQLPRAGLVHRLDKDTSGLLVIGKTIAAHTQLIKMIQNREVSREYVALVEGKLIAGGTIEQPIGRHPKLRTKMAVVSSGKEAVTHYRVLERFRAHTLLKVLLETGRTHQIRVHLSWAHYPLVGDSLYGWRLKLPPKASELLIAGLRGFKRQALHATRLCLQHPITGEQHEWEAPLPDDIAQLLSVLREDSKQ